MSSKKLKSKKRANHCKELKKQKKYINNSETENKNEVKNNKEKGNKKQAIKVLNIIILLICIAVACYSGFKIFIWFKENKQNQSIKEEINQAITIDEDEGEINVDFDSLKEKNSDTVAWIKVNGTEIQFPVVKTKNNSYYLTHSFDKSYNTAGWPFMDYKNKLDGTDKNIIIYGHNRKDGSMFSTLKNALTSEWQENSENLTILLITENEKIEYQVFSVYKVQDEAYYITTYFKNDKQYENYLNTMKRRSIKDFEVELTTEDQILTLSTCADNNKYRVVLHAKKVNNVK